MALAQGGQRHIDVASRARIDRFRQSILNALTNLSAQSYWRKRYVFAPWANAHDFGM